MAQYNAWANHRIWIKLAGHQAQSECIAKLSHIVLAESVCLSRLEGNAVKRDIFQPLSLEEIETFFGQNNLGWQACIQSTSETGLQTLLKYHTIKGDPVSNSVADILTHIFNHGTYHRAQIATLLRQNGIDPVVTDFIAFARENPQ